MADCRIWGSGARNQTNLSLVALQCGLQDTEANSSQLNSLQLQFYFGIVQLYKDMKGCNLRFK